MLTACCLGDYSIAVSTDLKSVGGLAVETIVDPIIFADGCIIWLLSGWGCG